MLSRSCNICNHYYTRSYPEISGCTVTMVLYGCLHLSNGAKGKVTILFLSEIITKDGSYLEYLPSLKNIY